MSQAITLTEGNFTDEVLRSDLPVLVDYWAAWCGPCRVLGPIVEELARERAGSLKVGKVDVDAEPKLAAKAGALSIPYVATATPPALARLGGGLHSVGRGPPLRDAGTNRDLPLPPAAYVPRLSGGLGGRACR